MSEVLSTINLFPENRIEVKKFAESVINSIAWGEVNVLELDGRLKAIEETIEMIRKSQEMNEALIVEANKYPQKTFDSGKYKHQIKEVGVKYDYSNCDDQELLEIELDAKAIKDRLTARQEFLKTIPYDLPVFDENGIRIFPPSKTSTTKVITLLK